VRRRVRVDEVMFCSSPLGKLASRAPHILASRCPLDQLTRPDLPAGSLEQPPAAPLLFSTLTAVGDACTGGCYE
jgi:hypothetical protein